MTSQEFSRLVAACSDLARRDPHGYRIRVLLLALLGYAYICGVLLLIGAGGAALLWIVGGSGGDYASVQLALPLIGAAWIVLRALRVELPPTPGIALSRSIEPRLFAEIEQIREELEAPRIDRVVLDNEFNAAVAHYPRWGPFGQRSVLVIGCTLLSSLTVDEIRSVLAHELGHVAGGHGRFAIWVYGLRTRWMQLLDALTGQAHWSAFLYLRFFRWYSPYFQAYTLVLSREHEFAADRASVTVAGPDAVADGLARATVTHRFLDSRFDVAARRLPATRSEPPADFPGLLRQATRRVFENSDAEAWLRQALAGTTHPLDSHPSFMDRLRAIGFAAPDAGAWCRRLKPNAGITFADSLLDAAPDHAARLAAEWREAVSAQWETERNRFRRMRAELEALDATPAGQNDGDRVRRVELVWQLDGAQAALEPARLLAAASPTTAEAALLLGGIMAELDDPESIRHLERAMTLDIGLVRPGLSTGYALLRRLGLEAEATLFEQRWETPAAESVESVWTSPMSDADRVRIRAAKSNAEREDRTRHGIRFGHASTAGLRGSLVLLALAAVSLGTFVWAYITPRLVPVPIFLVTAGTAIASLVALLVLRRKSQGEIELGAEGVSVRVGRSIRVHRWSDVRDWGIRGHVLTLVGAAGTTRLSTRPSLFPRLCDEVVRRVIAARRPIAAQGPIEPAAGWRTDTGPSRAKVREFRRNRVALAAATALQVLLIVAGAFRSVQLYILGLIGLGVVIRRIAKTPSAVSIGLRWIRILRPTGTESILLNALSGVEIAAGRDGFAVVVSNRFGEMRSVPAVNGDVLALFDAISANLEAGQESAAAISAPAPRQPRRIGIFRPAVALSFVLTLYLPIASGLAVSEAARTGSIPTVRLLLAMGSPVDGRGVGGRTPLYRAAMYGHMDLARMLVELGADPTFGSGPLGFTPLHVAAERNHTRLVRYLLDLGVDADIPNSRSQTPLYQLSWQTHQGDNTATARLLLDRGATVDSRSVSGDTPLHQAVLAGNEPLIRLLASRGANLDAAGSGGRPLHLAALTDDVGTAALLIRLGASIDSLDESDGRTALALAADHRSLEVVRLLLDMGADPDIADRYGYRPVHLLVMSGADEKTMRALLEHGADPNTVGYGEVRALPAAIMRHRNDLAFALLDAGADPVAAAAGWTPLRVAFRSRNQEMIDELYRRGAK